MFDVTQQYHRNIMKVLEHSYKASYWKWEERQDDQHDKN